MHSKMLAYQPMRQAPIRKPPWVKINIEILDKELKTYKMIYIYNDNQYISLIYYSLIL